MAIKRNTWFGTAGLNFIQDAELVGATIYMVTREGLEHDPYVSGDTNRKHNFTSSTGTVSFAIPFAPGGERVYALYKPAGSTDPDPPICTAVIAPLAGSLGYGVNGQSFAVYLALVGTAPFVITNVTKPAWMTITNSGNQITFTGTPNVTGVQTVELDITNCGGTVTYSDSVNILPPTNTLTIQNLSPGTIINSITNFNYIATSGLIIPPPMQTTLGIHDVYAGIPTFQITIGPFPFTLRFIVNSIPIQNINVSSSGTYPFTSVLSYNLSDDILIQLN